MMKLDGGAAVGDDEPLKLDACAPTCTSTPCPSTNSWVRLPEAKLRKLVRNMIYDGIVANLLSLDMEEVHKGVVQAVWEEKGKSRRTDWGALSGGLRYAAKTFTKSDPFRVQRMNSTAGKIIIEGNSAAALGCAIRRP